MSGKLCDGDPLTTGVAAVVRDTNAYCEGMHYRAGGTGAERPNGDNPHVINVMRLLRGTTDGYRPTITRGKLWSVSTADAALIRGQCQYEC